MGGTPELLAASSVLCSRVDVGCICCIILQDFLKKYPESFIELGQGVEAGSRLFNQLKLF